MPPRVTINYTSGLDDYYESILARINARFHSYQTTFPEYPMTEAEKAEHASLSAQAAHAGDGYRMVDDLHVRCPDGSVVHIERLMG